MWAVSGCRPAVIKDDRLCRQRRRALDVPTLFTETLACLSNLLQAAAAPPPPPLPHLQPLSANTAFLMYGMFRLNRAIKNKLNTDFPLIQASENLHTGKKRRGAHDAQTHPRPLRTVEHPPAHYHPDLDRASTSRQSNSTCHLPLPAWPESTAVHVPTTRVRTCIRHETRDEPGQMPSSLPPSAHRCFHDAF